MDTLSSLAASLNNNPLGVLALVVCSFVWLLVRLGTQVLAVIERLARRGRNS